MVRPRRKVLLGAEPAGKHSERRRRTEGVFALAFGHRRAAMGVRPSRGSVGDAYDNAMAESFFATLECELLARRRFPTQAEARVWSLISG